MKKLDIAVLIVYLVAMVVLCFFWKCRLDPWFAVIAMALVVLGTIWMIIQNQKLKKLQENRK